MSIKEKESKLVQTRINDKLNRWLEKSAEAEGLSVAAFLRRLIIQAESAHRTAVAWEQAKQASK